MQIKLCESPHLSLRMMGTQRAPGKERGPVQTLSPSDRQSLGGGKEDAKYGLRAEELGHGCESESQEAKKV